MSENVLNRNRGCADLLIIGVLLTAIASFLFLVTR